MKPLKQIGQTILAYRKEKPGSSCKEILEYVKKHFPGRKTTIASVASTLSHAGIAPGRLERKPADKHKLPTFDKPKAHKAEAEALEETEAQARERINVRYAAMKRLIPRCIAGSLPSVIVSGPPGMEKSWTAVEALKASGRQRHDGLTNVGGGGPHAVDGLETYGWYDQIQGACTAVGLYHALWNMRSGGVLLLDDCDAVFRDEDALNLLKVATDSTRERLVSWRKNAAWLNEFEIEKTFDFKGHIIFLTNVDFEEVIRRDHRDSEHFKALIDRAAYLCLTLRSTRDFIIRIKETAGGPNGFLSKAPYGLGEKQVAEIMDFIEANQSKFYNLSLRLAAQIAIAVKADPERWKEDVTATKMRTI